MKNCVRSPKSFKFYLRMSVTFTSKLSARELVGRPIGSVIGFRVGVSIHENANIIKKYVNSVERARYADEFDKSKIQSNYL